MSLLTGARTEEMRALTWTNVVAYDQDRQVWASVADVGWNHEDFGIYVWRSVRLDGDTKTDKSRRTLKLPERCVTALRALWDQQLATRAAAGDAWENNDLVFATRTGRKLSAGNVRREFRRVITKAGLVGTDWTPRELRHSFVSLLSDSGMPGGADIPAGRAPRDGRHRDGLPAPDPAGDGRGRHRHGWHLRHHGP